MARVEFSTMAVVRVAWRGEFRPGQLRDDGGLLARFRAWCEEVDILPAFLGSSGGGAFVGYYDPADADAIRAWLREQGAVEVDP